MKCRLLSLGTVRPSLVHRYVRKMVPKLRKTVEDIGWELRGCVACGHGGGGHLVL